MMFFEPVDRNTENSQTDLWYKQTDGGKTISEGDRHTADRRTNRQTNIQKDNNGRTDKQTRNKLTDKHKTTNAQTNGRWNNYLSERDRNMADNQTHRQTDKRTPSSRLTKCFGQPKQQAEGNREANGQVDR